MAADPLEIALLVAHALEDCGVRYLVGGSLASSIRGEGGRAEVDRGLKRDRIA